MDLKCKMCGTWMEVAHRGEDSNARDWYTFWCPECGAICGEITEREVPKDYHWQFPRLTAHPEVKVALEMQKDPKPS